MGFDVVKTAPNMERTSGSKWNSNVGFGSDVKSGRSVEVAKDELVATLPSDAAFKVNLLQKDFKPGATVGGAVFQRSPFNGYPRAKQNFQSAAINTGTGEVILSKKTKVSEAEQRILPDGSTTLSSKTFQGQSYVIKMDKDGAVTAESSGEARESAGDYYGKGVVVHDKGGADVAIPWLLAPNTFQQDNPTCDRTRAAQTSEMRKKGFGMYAGATTGMFSVFMNSVDSTSLAHPSLPSFLAHVVVSGAITGAIGYFAGSGLAALERKLQRSA